MISKTQVFTEKKFLEKINDIAEFMSCYDPPNEGVFHCYRECTNINHRWSLDSADNGKKLVILENKYSERDATTKLLRPQLYKRTRH
ncbi:unnamed protein product [Rhizophagus irregularis]|nr:unnamed protein product [Rhizophagus irregularis]